MLHGAFQLRQADMLHGAFQLRQRLSKNLVMRAVAVLFLSLAKTAVGFQPRGTSLPSRAFISARMVSALPLPPLEDPIRARTTFKRPGTTVVAGEGSSQVELPLHVPETIPALSDVLYGLSGAGNNGTDLSAQAPKTAESRSDAKNAAAKEQTVRSSAQQQQPWKAGYYTSIKTQRKIKQAAWQSNKSGGPAVRVLRTFLETPPERCNAANLVCALTLSAKVLRRQRPTSELRSLLFQATGVLREMVGEDGLSARQLCNSVWAIAKHYNRDQRLLPSPYMEAAMSSDSVIGRAETLDLRSSRTGPAQQLNQAVDEIALALSGKLGENPLVAKEGELCMASWAYGILRPRSRPPGWRHDPQIGQVEQQANRARRANLVKFEKWSTENADSNEECSVLDPLSATDLLFDAIGNALTSEAPTAGKGAIRIESCKWSELANLAWAFASHGRACSLSAQNLMVVIAKEASWRITTQRLRNGEVQSRDVTQILWALGAMQCDNFRIADSLVELVEAVSADVTADVMHNSSPFGDWSCADIVQIVLALAHARIDDADLLRGLYDEATLRLERQDEDRVGSTLHRRSFRPWEISILLWAQARLYLTSAQDPVYDRFVSDATSRIAMLGREKGSLAEVGIGSQEGANIAWSLTVLEKAANKDATFIISRVFDEAAGDCKQTGMIHLEHAHQLWQALFLLEEEAPDTTTGVSKWFRDYLQEKWVAEKARTKISSARHRSLSKALDLMGVAHKNEHDEDIDVAIVLKPEAAWTHETDRRIFHDSSDGDEGLKVAVEFDGPNHFTRQRQPRSEEKAQPPRTLGHTVLKYRLLKKQGWTVVRVPFFEFDRIPFWASMERQRYLQRLLKTHGNLRFSHVDVSEYSAPKPNRKSRFD